MFNCGMMAIDLPEADVQRLFDFCGEGPVDLKADPDTGRIQARSGDRILELAFSISGFDKTLVQTGGWVEYADQNY